MTQPRPTAAELIAAVREFLADEVLGELEGRKRFHAKVAVNVLDTIERELRVGPGSEVEERARLTELLGPEAAIAHPVGADGLARELAARIRSGEVDIEDQRLIDHLRKTAAADVAIANPRWAP